jgi:hypothetical protein
MFCKVDEWQQIGAEAFKTVPTFEQSCRIESGYLISQRTMFQPRILRSLMKSPSSSEQK